MRNVLKLVPVYIGSLFCIVILGAAVALVHSAGSVSALSLRLMATIVRSVVPVSTLLALLGPMLYWGRHRSSRMLSYVLLAVVGFVFCAGSVWLLATMMPAPGPAGSLPAAVAPGRVLYSGRTMIYAHGEGHRTLGPVIVADPGRDEPPRLTLYRSGRMDAAGSLALEGGPGGKRTELPVSGTVPVDLVAASGAPVAALPVPPAGSSAIGRVEAEIDGLTGTLYAAASGPLASYLMLTGAITILFLSIWFFARLTGWPLLNAALALVVFRLFLMLFSALSNADIRRLLASVLPFLSRDEAMPAVFAGCGILLMLCDGLLWLARGPDRKESA